MKITHAIKSTALLSAAGLALTACSSMHTSSSRSNYSSSYGSVSESSGANASGEWKRGAGSQQYQASASSDYSASSEAQSEASADQSSATGREEIRIPLHAETVQVGKRTVDAGQVVIRKVVTTERVNQPVELRRETLVIDRVDSGDRSTASSASSSSDSSFAPFQEKAVTIRLQKEEPVVQKQTVVTGNVVARRSANTERSNVQEQIRREDVQLDRSGATENVVIHGNFINEGAGAQRPSQQQQDQQDQQRDQSAHPQDQK
jgi:uncharacterized protein (TIGR02271 family)